MRRVVRHSVLGLLGWVGMLVPTLADETAAWAALGPVTDGPTLGTAGLDDEVEADHGSVRNLQPLSRIRLEVFNDLMVQSVCHRSLPRLAANAPPD
jgi:hypothetical protein